MDFLNFNFGGENSYLLYGLIGLAVLATLTFAYFQFSKSGVHVGEDKQHEEAGGEIYGAEETAHHQYQEPVNESHSTEEAHPEPMSCDDGKCYI